MLLGETNFTDIGIPRRGKVRDIYDLGDKLLVVTTDRLSAFDVVLPTLIVDKGKNLNLISLFWFDEMQYTVGNHILETDVDRYPQQFKKYADQLWERSVLVRKAKVIPVECIVRGYLSGSGWTKYQKGLPICGIKLPDGLLESQKLENPIFTPTKKAETGHDEDITFDEMVKMLGPMAYEMKEKSLEIYNRAFSIAESKGIIIADTKFEFGMVDRTLIIIDELLTPDSSRFWDAETYEPGRSQDSYDKQIVRDYLETLDWDKTYPGPELPASIAYKTAKRYREIFLKLTANSI